MTVKKSWQDIAQVVFEDVAISEFQAKNTDAAIGDFTTYLERMNNNVSQLDHEEIRKFESFINTLHDHLINQLSQDQKYSLNDIEKTYVDVTLKAAQSRLDALEIHSQNPTYTGNTQKMVEIRQKILEERNKVFTADEALKRLCKRNNMDIPPQVLSDRIQRLNNLLTDLSNIKTLPETIIDGLATRNLTQLMALETAQALESQSNSYNAGNFENVMRQNGMDTILSNPLYQNARLTRDDIQSLKIHIEEKIDQELARFRPAFEIVNDLREFGFPKNDKLNRALYDALKLNYTSINDSNIFPRERLTTLLKTMSEAKTDEELTTALALPENSRIKLPAKIRAALIEENKRRPTNYTTINGYFDKRAREKEFEAFEKTDGDEKLASIVRFAAYANQKSKSMQFESKNEAILKKFIVKVTDVKSDLEKYRYYLDLKLHAAEKKLDEASTSFAKNKINNEISRIRNKISIIDSTNPDNAPLINLASALTQLKKIDKEGSDSTQRIYYSSATKAAEPCNNYADALTKANEYIGDRNPPTPLGGFANAGNPNDAIRTRGFSNTSVNYTLINTPDAQNPTIPVAVIQEVNNERTFAKQTIVGNLNLILGSGDEGLAKFAQENVDNIRAEVKKDIYVGPSCPQALGMMILRYCDYKGIPCHAPAAYLEAFKAEQRNYSALWSNPSNSSNLGYREIASLPERTIVPKRK